MALIKGTPATGTGNTGETTLAFTAMGGSNRKLIVAVEADGNVITTATLGGSALTLVGSASNSTRAYNYIYERNDASSGNIVIDFAGSANNIVGYLEWSGADSAALVPTTNTGSTSSITITVTGTTAGDTVFASFTHPDPEAPPHTMGGGQTSEWDVNSSPANNNGAGSTKAAGGDITQTSNITNTRAWSAVATVVKAAGAGATPGFMWLS